jgi:hypothetical protein
LCWLECDVWFIVGWLVGWLQEGKERTDLISHFMNQAKKEGSELSDSHLRDITVNFLVAGRDTTSVALRCCVGCVCCVCVLCAVYCVLLCVCVFVDFAVASQA